MVKQRRRTRKEKFDREPWARPWLPPAIVNALAIATVRDPVPVTLPKVSIQGRKDLD